MNIPALRFKEFNDEWQSEKFHNLVELRKDSYLENFNFNVDIELENLVSNEGRIIGNIERRTNSKYIFKTGDILLGKLRPALHKWWLANTDGIKSDEIWALKSNLNVDNHFNYYLIQSSYFIHELTITEGTKMPRAQWSHVKNIKVSIPDSINEQQKIGSFFTKIDQLIALHEQKLALLKQKKQGYLQKLFPQLEKTMPQLRFKDFNDAWQKVKLNNIYQKSKEKNTELVFNQKQVISVANMYFNNDNELPKSTNEYMKTYNVMHLGDIAFEGNRSKEFFSGRFVLNDIGDGIVSHVFEIFHPIIKNDLVFMKYYIHSEQVMHPILLHSTTKTIDDYIEQ